MRDRAENLLKDLIKRMFAGNYMEPDKSYPTEVTWAGCRRLEDGSMEIEVAVDSVRHVPPHPVKFTVKKIEEQIRNLVTMGIILEHEVEAVTKKFKDQLTDSVKKMGTKNDKDHIGKFLLEDYPGYDPGKEINRIIIGPLGASDQPPNMVAPNTTQAGDPSHPSSHSSPDPTLEKPPPKPEHEVNQSEKLEKEVEEIKIKSSTAPPVATSEPVVTKAIGRFNMKPVVEDTATKNTIQKDENTQTNEQTIDKISRDGKVANPENIEENNSKPPNKVLEESTNQTAESKLKDALKEVLHPKNNPNPITKTTTATTGGQPTLEPDVNVSDQMPGMSVSGGLQEEPIETDFRGSADQDKEDFSRLLADFRTEMRIVCQTLEEQNKKVIEAFSVIAEQNQKFVSLCGETLQKMDWKSERRRSSRIRKTGVRPKIGKDSEFDSERSEPEPEQEPYKPNPIQSRPNHTPPASMEPPSGHHYSAPHLQRSTSHHKPLTESSLPNIPQEVQRSVMPPPANPPPQQQTTNQMQPSHYPHSVVSDREAPPTGTNQPMGVHGIQSMGNQQQIPYQAHYNYQHQNHYNRIPTPLMNPMPLIPSHQENIMRNGYGPEVLNFALHLLSNIQPPNNYGQMIPNPHANQDMNPLGSLPASFYTSQPASLHGGQTNEPTSKPPTQQMGMNNCGQSNSNMNVRQQNHVDSVIDSEHPQARTSQWVENSRNHIEPMNEVSKDAINRATYDPNQANRGFTENPPPQNTGTKTVPSGGGGNSGVPNQAGGLGTGNPTQNNHRDTQKILQSFNQMNQMMTHPNINMNAQPGMHPSQTFSNTGGMHTIMPGMGQPGSGQPPPGSVQQNVGEQSNLNHAMANMMGGNNPAVQSNPSVHRVNVGYSTDPMYQVQTEQVRLANHNPHGPGGLQAHPSTIDPSKNAG